MLASRRGLLGIVFFCALFACAQGAAKKIRFEIEEGAAKESLLAFAMQSECDLIFEKTEVAAIQTNAVSGKMVPSEALELMLQGTSLGFIQDGDSGAFAIIFSGQTDPESTEDQLDGGPVDSPNTNPEIHKNTDMKKNKSFLGKLLAGLAGLAVAANTPQMVAQEGIEDEEVFELSPFEVTTDANIGYLATSSLAGSRIDTDLKDVASPISVVTREFIDDTASVDIKDILVYQTNAEVAGIGGNYYGSDANDGAYRNRLLVNPQQGTRLRGLNTADLTRSFYATSIPIDAFNTERLDIQRGPNSILFGLGSPAGIINTTLRDPVADQRFGEVRISADSYGSHRESIDYNIPLVEKTLTARVIGLNDQQKFRQDFTYEDDNRVYAALRWQPKLAEGIYTQVDARYEYGKISANRPVAVTAADFISNWFGPLNQYLMYDPQTSNGIPTDPNGVQHRELSHYFAGAPARDWWNDSPATIFQDPTSSAIGNGWVDAYRQRDGSPWGGLSGVTNANLDEGGSGTWNKNTKDYYAGNALITDIINRYESSTGNVFSGFGSALWPTQMILEGPLAFIDQPIQGPNKREWNEWDNVELSLTQTFLNGIIGYNIGYYEETYESGYTNLIDSNRVSVDVNTVLRDYSDNPDVGRPFIYAPARGNNNEEKRRAFRATAFAKFNPADYFDEGWLTKIVGEQSFTGVHTNQRYENFDVSYNLYAWDVNTYGDAFIDSHFYKSWYGLHYIGDNLQGISNFSDIPYSAIQGVNTVQTPGGSSNTLVWDNHTTTWRSAQVNIINYREDLDHLYTGTSQGYDTTDSLSFVWQGKFLNDAIVPLFGWRRDEYERWDKPSTLVRDEFGTPLPYSSDWNYDNSTPLVAEEERRSWGLVMHVDKILEVFDLKMPEGITLSLNYNESNSFRPSQVGSDIYGNTFPSPLGETKDYGFLLTALDNKVALRVTWYETVQKNTTLSDPSGMIFWAKAGVVRTINALAQETWGSQRANPTQTTPEWLVNEWFLGEGYDQSVANQPLPANWRDQMDQLVNQPLRIRRAAVAGSPNFVAEGDINPDSGSPWLAPPLDDEEIEYRIAWFAARSDSEWFGPLDMTFVNAKEFEKVSGDDWRIWGEGSPAGQILTNDLVSKGLEVELTMNPMPNWRLTFNASKAEAVRDNILPDWAEFIEGNKDLWFDGFDNNEGGPSQLNYWKIDGLADVRHWTGNANYSSVQDTFGGRMMQNVFSSYQNLIAGEGESVNELRKWRMNFVTNYKFLDGKFKNLNVGGAVRWQDKAAIGYYPRYEDEADIWVTDPTNPIMGPSETDIDMWVGYERTLAKGKIDWSIQLNVRNLFSDDDLIPIRANPDGTVAQVRIPSERVWMLTNTFKF